MATRFSHSSRLDGTLDSIHTALGNKEFWEDRIRSAGTSRDSLDRLELDGETIAVTLTQIVPDDAVPDFARKVLPAELSIQRRMTYTRSDDRIATDTRADAAGGLGQITAESQTVADNGSALETVEGRVKVAIPLLGGKLEKVVVSHLTELLEAEHEHFNRWLSGS